MASLEIADSIGTIVPTVPRMDDVDIINIGAPSNVPLTTSPAIDMVTARSMMTPLLQKVSGDLTRTTEVAAPQTRAR